MQTRLATRRNPLRRRGARLAAALLPLPALLAPAPALASVSISICSGGAERVITIPSRETPTRREDQPGCAHFVCPRERGHGDPADEEEE